MEPAELWIVVAAIGLGAFVKGVTGSGLPQIAIPVMAGFLGVERSVVIMAIPSVVSNVWLVWKHRSHLLETRDLPALACTGTVGAVVGTVLLTSLEPRVLSGVLAGLILLYATLRVGRPTLRLSAGMTRWLAPPVGLAAGALQGATGMSGPLLTTYLHGYRLTPPVFVISLVTLFQVFAVMQVATLMAVGSLTVERAVEGGLALVPMAAALPLGERFARRLTGRGFDLWVIVLLLGTAVKLAVEAVAPR